MLSFHLEVQGFGDDGETIYETDEINKDMNEFCILIVDQKSDNTKHTTKYDKQTLSKFFRKKNKLREARLRRSFFHCKTFVKEKNGVAYKPSTLTYFHQNVQQHFNTIGSKVYLQKENGIEPLKFLPRFQKHDERNPGGCLPFVLV